MVGERGTIYLYTGEGAGKTTNALGLALRCLGHGYKVVIIQFLKWWKNTGEYKFKKKMPNYEVYQFGRKGWIGLTNLTEKDKQLCKKALNFAKKKAKEKPRLQSRFFLRLLFCKVKRLLTQLFVFFSEVCESYPAFSSKLVDFIVWHLLLKLVFARVLPPFEELDNNYFVAVA